MKSKQNAQMLTKRSTSTLTDTPPLNPVALTQLAFLINYIIAHHRPDLSLDEVRAAARQGHLLTLLATRYGDIADFYYLVREPSRVQQLEAALTTGVANLTWRERCRLGISSSGLSMVMAIIVEALLAHLCQSPPPGSSAHKWN